MALLQSVFCASTTKGDAYWKSPLEWWKHHESQFLLFAKLVFPVPAASTKSERVFSVASNVVTPRGPS